MIEAVGLSKRYGAMVAVDALSFTVPPGQVTGFLGPNGAGKTTTMRMIVGLAGPTAGRVTVNGRLAGLATVVEPEDRVEVDGQWIEPEPLTYVLLHKPAGVVTTARDPQGRPTVVGLVDSYASLTAAVWLFFYFRKQPSEPPSQGGLQLQPEAASSATIASVPLQADHPIESSYSDLLPRRDDP